MFRAVAGVGFISVGYVYRDFPLGLFSIGWGALALIAGTMDICFISVVLGGTLSGKKIREFQKTP